MNPEPFASENYNFEEVDSCTLITRVTPFTAIEKSIIRKQNRESQKNAIKININSEDTPEQVAMKTREAIVTEPKLGENQKSPSYSCIKTHLIVLI